MRENAMPAMGNQRPHCSQTTKPRGERLANGLKKIGLANFLVDLGFGLKYSLA
jgi:hypothetical protein